MTTFAELNPDIPEGGGPDADSDPMDEIWVSDSTMTDEEMLDGLPESEREVMEYENLLDSEDENEPVWWPTCLECGAPLSSAEPSGVLCEACYNALP